MTHDNTNNNPPVATAGHLIISMRNGAANDLATSELEKLVKAVQETGKSGTVTIKMKVEKLKDGDTEVKVEMKVSSAIPVADIPAGIYYPGDGGTLHRTDPRQLSMLDRTDGDISRVGRGQTIDA